MVAVGVISHGHGLTLARIPPHSLPLQLALVMSHRNLDHRIQAAGVDGMANQGSLDTEGKQDYSMSHGVEANIFFLAATRPLIGKTTTLLKAHPKVHITRAIKTKVHHIVEATEEVFMVKNADSPAKALRTSVAQCHNTVEDTSATYNGLHQEFVVVVGNTVLLDLTTSQDPTARSIITLRLTRDGRQTPERLATLGDR
jgi:hypothetical protein